MGPRSHFYPYLYHCDYIELLGTGFMQVLYLARVLRTKKTLPDFLKWRRVTRHPLVFRGLTGSQRTPGFGASHEKFQFLEKEQNRNFGYKIVISVKNSKFILWISDDETDFTVGIVSRNLASMLNFVKFRDSWNLNVFRGIAFRVQ